MIAFAAVALVLAQPPQQYRADGEVLGSQSSASFDTESVRGPRVSVTREENGRWVGRLKDVVVDVKEVKNGVRGANVALYLERVKDGFMVRGNMGNQTVSIHVPDDPQLRYYYRWTLKGQADTLSPPTPQYIFSVIAAFG